MLSIYVKLVNAIFDNGIIPENWTIGQIKAIYKNKGNPTLPENYRPISLLSCFGKLFTCILNKRLNKFSEKYNLINESQACFRKKLSTTDNIFILKTLIDVKHANKKKLYCCFIDFKQAFDYVWRQGLWQKLQSEKINGKCLKIKTSMYNNIKSQVITSQGQTAFFDCLVGVRQGENLSPFLFNIFLNDLHQYLNSCGINGLNKEISVHGLQIYLKMFLLLYADDTAIFSDDPSDLQNALDNFKTYCDNWKLNINLNKTQVMIIGKGNTMRNITHKFKIGNADIETVNEYKYIGIYFTKTGSFVKTKKYIAEQATKAMFALLRKIKALSLPYDLQIDLFEK